MSYSYFPPSGNEAGYWLAYDPTLDDLENMMADLGSRRFYNFVVQGVPCDISPEWLAKHGHIGEEPVIDPQTGKQQVKYGKKVWRRLPDFKYEYASSYSIHIDDLHDMFQYNDTVLDAFNYYLEGTGKCWLEIELVKLVDRRQKWDGTY